MSEPLAPVLFPIMQPLYMGFLHDACFFFFFFLQPNLQHMEVPRLGVESELQLLVCATAIQI